MPDSAGMLSGSVVASSEGVVGIRVSGIMGVVSRVGRTGSVSFWGLQPHPVNRERVRTKMVKNKQYFFMVYLLKF
jgi:hypothetical protein